MHSSDTHARAHFHILGLLNLHTPPFPVCALQFAIVIDMAAMGMRCVEFGIDIDVCVCVCHMCVCLCVCVCACLCL